MTKANNKSTKKKKYMIHGKKRVDKLPLVTFVHKGMPLTIVATNPSTKLGAVNGTECTFVRFHPQPQLRESKSHLQWKLAEKGRSFRVVDPDCTFPDVMFVHMPGFETTDSRDCQSTSSQSFQWRRRRFMCQHMMQEMCQ